MGEWEVKNEISIEFSADLAQAECEFHKGKFILYVFIVVEQERQLIHEKMYDSYGELKAKFQEETKRVAKEFLKEIGIDPDEFMGSASFYENKKGLENFNEVRMDLH